MKRLVIDVPALLRSGVSAETIRCEYLFHRKNQGPLTLLEVAEFASFCRQCREAFCVSACPKEALERQSTGVVKRYNMRCVGCKSCILACPFGTIFPEVIHYVTSACDYCLTQTNKDSDYLPLCVKSAPEGSFTIQEVTEEDPSAHFYFVGDHLAVKSPSWRRKEGRVCS